MKEFRESMLNAAPDAGLSPALEALWWDARGDWIRAHALVDDAETKPEMAVHAYLHRKEGSEWNADYWYRRAGRESCRASFITEWEALVEELVANEA